MDLTPELNKIHEHISTLETGVSYMTALISAAIAFIVGGGLGWWLGPKATTGVQTDIATVKTDIEDLKTKVGV